MIPVFLSAAKKIFTTKKSKSSDSVKLMITVDMIRQFFSRDRKIFTKHFPQGCLATEENVQYLIDKEFNFGIFTDGSIPVTGCFIDDGDKCWLVDGRYHREGGPAVIYADGHKAWYQNGQLHRKDGPAVEWANGSKYWYLNGNLHREGGPAVEYADGRKYWYLNNRLIKSES